MKILDVYEEIGKDGWLKQGILLEVGGEPVQLVRYDEEGIESIPATNLAQPIIRSETANLHEAMRTSQESPCVISLPKV